MYQYFLLTLIDNVEAKLVLGIVTVEEESGLVGGAEQRAWHHWAAEPINHCSRFQTSTAHLQIVVYRLCREVQKLQVDPWNNKIWLCIVVLFLTA